MNPIATDWAWVLDGAWVRLNPRPGKKTEKVEEALWEPERALLLEAGERRDRGGWSGGKVRGGGPLGARGWDLIRRRAALHWSWVPPVWKGEWDECEVEVKWARWVPSPGLLPVVVKPFGRLGGRVQPPRRGGVVGWEPLALAKGGTVRNRGGTIPFSDLFCNYEYLFCTFENQFCTNENQFCTNEKQFCTYENQFCEYENQFCNYENQFCNYENQFCNYEDQFCNYEIQLCIYENQICTCENQFYKSENEFCTDGNLSIIQKNERGNCNWLVMYSMFHINSKLC